MLKRRRLPSPPTSPLPKKPGRGGGNRRRPQQGLPRMEIQEACIWKPLFTLSLVNPVLDDGNLKDPQKGSSSLMGESLEKALCLLEDMAELRSFRRRKFFLTLKQDLGKVYLFLEFALLTCKNFNQHFFFRPSKSPLWPRNGWTIPWTWPKRPRISWRLPRGLRRRRQEAQ